MIGSLLIANRGEIARRVIRTARRLGVRTIAVFSDADAAALHVKEADAAVRIGPPPVRESYLRGEAILEAARAAEAEAIHPGYGFLSENADFAEAVEAAGLVWVGAPPASIRAMGLKDAAKRLMAQAGVPVTPGYLGDDQSPEVLAAEAAQIGWPVLIKAVAGGGGKGMRAVARPEDFAEALAGARREAASAFGDDRVLLEKLIASPRHIEVQVFADAHGGVVHLFERDCSLQRRHQKVIEEAPAPGMDAATRTFVTDAAIRAARSVGYRGAGTIEFIADGSEGLRPDRIWFMEMNTRLQVEHPVTEAITGLDLVEWQLRVASGEPLPVAQDEITLTGHAMEARLYAEDPAHGFLPSTGRLDHLRLPTSVRVDSGVEQGDRITPFYDPMIAKLIAHGRTREAAAAGLAEAARAVEVWPVRTNAAFLARCAAHPDFTDARIDTGFIERRLDELIAPPPPPPEAVGALSLAEGEATSPWAASRGPAGFRLNASARTTAAVRVDGHPAELPFAFGPASAVRLDADELVTFRDGAALRLSLASDPAAGAEADFDGGIRTPMPGRIVKVAVELGARVQVGQVLVVLEAMKMEHTLTAPVDGRVTEVAATEGDQVVENLIVVRLEAAEA
ncbi:MAG TPA: biotin carboxylase N-terminal domain-containing protein [Caulobacteraceae bacterium]|jgi:3-methylcrotonyl-CoA carboxylase alpha subunit|nr:biotin carboxylase N-terminal domain-containing protein [Caulobacteraceae bacterium]